MINISSLNQQGKRKTLRYILEDQLFQCIATFIVKMSQIMTKSITHRIEDWTIRESTEPFPEQEIRSKVHQWSVDDVCLFFKQIIGVDCYTSVLQEHQIDGLALVLLKEEHLFNIFKMPKQSREKILQHIQKYRI